VLLLSSEGKDSGKLTLIAYVPSSLESKISASEWVNHAAQATGGKGGGKSGYANGAAKDCTGNFQKVIDAATQFVTNKLSGSSTVSTSAPVQSPKPTKPTSEVQSPQQSSNSQVKSPKQQDSGKKKSKGK